MSTQINIDELGNGCSTPSKIHQRECPLRSVAKKMPVQCVKKSIWAVYKMIMVDVFSHSIWNGW